VTQEDIMTSFVDQHKVDILIEAAKGRRVVKNKAQALATQGRTLWNNALRQALIDNHARFETWESVAGLLNRSNQALRSEWNKMKNGQRENEGNWKKKVEVCEAHRKTVYSMQRSGNGHTTTAMTAPATITHETDASGPSSRTATTTRSPNAETSSSTTLGASPGEEVDLWGP
jgi:glutamine synthetase adenylyltransferase